MSDDTSNNAPSPKTEFELAQETYCAAELVEKTEIICKVCGDAASGRHYGVVSCEGCKGFFKRTIQLKLTYKCKQLQNSQKNSDATFVDKDGVTRCVIDKDSRNDCQKCRFDICVAVGMNEQLIRKDFPGATKKRRIQDAGSESSSDASTDVSSPSSTISNHDSLYNEYALVDDDKNLLKTLTSIQADKVPWCNQKHQLPLDSPMPESLKPELSELFQSAFEELRDVVRWARQVPGFTDISTEDQMTLLKNCFLDIIVFRLSWRSTPYQDKVLFNKGFCLNLEEAISLGLDPELFHLTLHYVKLLRNIGLDLTEFCTMQAIMLTFARCNNISTASQNTATQMQNRFMQCLCRYVKSTHPTQPLRYCRIIQLLSSIKGLSIKAMDRFLTQALTGEIMVDDYVYNFVT